jgi:hypothetical protein
MLFFILLCQGSSLSAKDMDDVIIFKNGDRLTGEIKRLEQGQLYFKNSSMYETIQLDWEKIERVISSRRFVLDLTNGARFVGLIEKVSGAVGAAETVAIRGPQGVTRAAQREVVEIRPIEENFWKQIKGEVDFGFSYARGNQQTNYTLYVEANRVAPRYRIKTTLDSQFSRQSEGANTGRHNLSLEPYIFLKGNWFVPGFASFLKNNQQHLDLRTTIGSGLGRYLLRTNRSHLAAFSGIVWTRERYSPDAGITTSGNEAEVLTGLDYSTFRFNKTEFDTRLLVLPSLSRPGRVRLDWKSNFQIKLISNLYWKTTFYANYDSAPPSNTSKSDYGTTSSVGWTF